MSDLEFEVADEDQLLMHNYETLPRNCKKYWRKRYLLFSKFDDGVYMTAEMWFSVTPEATAEFTAKLVQQLVPDCQNVLDVCCGCGGNTIQFAKRFRSVGAVDISAVNVQCSQHNCGVYGVADRTWFAVGDWNELSKTTDWVPEGVSLQFDFIFCSPPWGGPRYKYQDTFDLSAMEPFNLKELCESLGRFTKNFGLFLPRNLDFDQIRAVTRELYGDTMKTRIVCLWQNGLPLGILAVFGPSYSIEIA